jgi:D-alanine-D-alanine ligase
MKKLTVALLFGGKSGEHEVSLRSAASILKALDRNKYDVIPIGITKEGQWRSDPEFLEAAFPEILTTGRMVLLPPDPLDNSLMQIVSDGKAIGNQAKIDVVFPALHGTYGEDGTIQGLLDMADLPYVGAGVLGSSVGMDKDVMKRLLQHAGLPIVDFVVVLDHQWQGKKQEVRGIIENRLGFPCFVKPANLGSSVGISKVKNSSELDSAMDLAAQYDRKIIIEKGLEVREIECSVLGNDDPRASLPGEIVPSNEFYDYESKYLDDRSSLLIPAPLEEAQIKAIQELAIRTFLVTECSGLARVDFFVEKGSNLIYVNEINTMPGFTSISMYPKLWEASGLGYSELIDRLIQLAIERHRGRQSKKTTY